MTIKLLLSLLLRLKRAVSLSFSLYITCSGPSNHGPPLDSLQYDDVFLVLGAHYSRFGSSTEMRIMTTFLNLLAVLLLTPTNRHLVFIAARAHC